ncbi:MAG: hypothetical protein ACI9FR_003431 [Cryomorphaceae bacterium]|jgi:hypothetical protein
MIRAFLKQLNAPFPDHLGGLENLRYMIAVGTFVALFLYVLRPFGLHRETGNVALICVSYGLITVAFGMSFHLICRYVLRLRTHGASWTLWKWILQSICMVTWIAIGNFLYLFVVDETRFLNLDVFLGMLKTTMVVGFFPVVVSGLIVQLRAARIHQRDAADIALPEASLEPNQTLVSFALSSNDNLELEFGQIRYLEAMQNYVSIYFLRDGELRCELVRTTIAKVATQLHSSSVVRCHRSFLVNIESVRKVSGNAQGLRLKLDRVSDFEVPVSRPYIAELRALLNR